VRILGVVTLFMFLLAIFMPESWMADSEPVEPTLEEDIVYFGLLGALVAFLIALCVYINVLRKRIEMLENSGNSRSGENPGMPQTPNNIKCKLCGTKFIQGDMYCPSCGSRSDSIQDSSNH